MNSKEKRKLLRRFCNSTSINHTFTTYDKADNYITLARERYNLEEDRLQIVHCTVCGDWHLLLKSEYVKYKIHNKFSDIERQIILNEPFDPEKDYSRKRTVAKRIGRYAHIQKFPKKKPRFGTVPDDGFFDWKVSQRFVCFNCRKSWRRHPRTYQLKCCPDCAGEVKQVYPMFRAPKKNDIKAWESLRKRYNK